MNGQFGAVVGWGARVRQFWRRPSPFDSFFTPKPVQTDTNTRSLTSNVPKQTEITITKINSDFKNLQENFR